MLTLLKRLGRAYQLLITLDAASPPDVAYSRRLKEFAASRGMPVVIGFGGELISRTSRRTIKNGVVTRYNLRDLYALCSGALVTSVVEGFGLAYHEGWLCRRPVIGRKIPEIVADFEANGLNFDHAYERLAVSLDDLPGLRPRLIDEYEKKLRAMRGRKPFARLTSLSADDIIDAKLFHAGGRDCVDFADLSLEMQFELAGGLMDDPVRASQLIDRNPAIASAHEILEDDMSDRAERLIDTNRAAVRARYSLDAMAGRLENIFETGDAIYTKKHERIPLTQENHAAVMRRYLRPENLRLIF
jgi:glycosyltransferase involved in cell wall biosynthesis